MRQAIIAVLVVLGTVGGVQWPCKAEEGPYLASWFSVETCKCNKDPLCPMASRMSLYEAERIGTPFCASYDYEMGQWLEVTNIQNGLKTRCVKLDVGPNRRLRRKLDLSKKCFSEIADLKKGVVTVKIKPLT